MIVKKLELVNFQVIKEFTADFTGNVYFITGDNELGKSTVLKAIGALLTGNRDAVLRNGEDKGYAKMVVGGDGKEYEVELKYTKANPRGTLTIKADGMKSNNVSMLQQLFGYQDFDAVEFSRWSETAEGRRRQIAVVKSLLPQEIQARIQQIDAETAEARAARTDVNRDLKTYASICKAAGAGLNPGDEETYKVRKDITALMEEQRVNAQLIEKAKTVRAAREQRIEQLAGIEDRKKEAAARNEAALQDAENYISRAEEDYRKALEDAENLLKASRGRYEELLGEAASCLEKDIEEIRHDEEDYKARKANADKWLESYEANNPEKLDTAEQLRKAEEHNMMCAKVEDYAQKKAKYEEIAKEAGDLDDRIDGLLCERADLIKTSDLPIAGLSFAEDGLELNGVPFLPGKVSDSQIMEVATKLVIASNPTVKVFRIARGESLGAKRLQEIVEIAKRSGFQGFIEEVHRGQDDLVVEEYTEKE